MKYRHITIHPSIPEPMYTWLNVEAARKGISFTHMVVRAILPAMGLSPDTYDSDMRKPSGKLHTTSQVQFHVDPIYEQVPLNMMELAHQPYRNDHVYDILLSLGWAGNEDGSIKPSETTIEERENIKQLRKLYSIKN